MADFKGEWYLRKRSGTFRNRRTGSVITNVTVKKTKGKRDKAIFWNGSEWIGIEPNYQHIYAFDPKKSDKAKDKFEVRVKSNKPSAKKQRKSHRRKVR